MLAPQTTLPATSPPASPAILGGGLAGSALALLLARAGHPVTLLEQHATPHHKVCGDFLSAEALAYLAALGLDPTGQLGAVPLSTLRLATSSRLTETSLPFPAASLTRFALDEALLQLAVREPRITLLRGSRVNSLSQPKPPQPWGITLSNGRHLGASTVFLATGKHDLRGYPRAPGRHRTLVAFKHYLRLSAAQHAALGPAIELTLFPNGYAGLQPVEPDAFGPRANLCLVIEATHLNLLGGSWPALLGHLLATVPHLRTRIADASPLLPKPLALSRIPYGLLLDTPPAPGLWPLGDQAAVIPSLTGDGMSIALHTAHLAAAKFLEGESAAAYLARLYETLHGQLALATLTSRLAVRPGLQPWLGLAAAAHPALLQHLARATRIPARARLLPASPALAPDPVPVGY